MEKALCIETIFTEVPFYERFKMASDAGFKSGCKVPRL